MAKTKGDIMYRIGEFSKIVNLPIRTLRYYNEIGLLIPEEVDCFSNYRYYSDYNIEEANKIEKYKNAGFTLEEIRDNFENITEDVYLQKKLELYEKMEKIAKQIKELDNLKNAQSVEKDKVKVMRRKPLL